MRNTADVSWKKNVLQALDFGINLKLMRDRRKADR